jgi:catechol 2,3-dioxygenase-like lactoylglutathione lyase family enzyme
MKTFLACGALLLLLATSAQLHPSQKAPVPLLLDHIHYYVSDRGAAEAFFIEHFAAQVIPNPGPRPLEFITFLNLRAGEGTISVSPRGSYEGISTGTSSRLKREVIEPKEDSPPLYGVYWLALRTASLNHALTRLEIEGVRVTQRTLSMPHDLLARAVMIEGPDYNNIALVERRNTQRSRTNEKVAWGDFGIDHIMVLVEEVKTNEDFFRNVYSAKVIARRPSVATLKIADATIVLAEPEAVGLKRESVQSPAPGKFRYGVNHLGFLYADIKAPVETAKAKGYTFISDTFRVKYFDQPTVYTLATIISPDGLLCEMFQEDGRTGPHIQQKR